MIPRLLHRVVNPEVTLGRVRNRCLSYLERHHVTWHDALNAYRPVMVNDIHLSFHDGPDPLRLPATADVAVRLALACDEYLRHHPKDGRPSDMALEINAKLIVMWNEFCAGVGNSSREQGRKKKPWVTALAKKLVRENPDAKNLDLWEGITEELGELSVPERGRMWYVYREGGKLWAALTDDEKNGHEEGPTFDTFRSYLSKARKP